MGEASIEVFFSIKESWNHVELQIVSHKRYRQDNHCK